MRTSRICFFGALLGSLLIGFPTGRASGAEESPAAPEALLTAARSAEHHRRFREAVTFYSRSLDAALESGACALAAEAAQGFREAVFFTGDDGRLGATLDGLLKRLPADPACVRMPVLQMALGYQVLGDPVRGLEICRDAGKGLDEASKLFFDRAAAHFENRSEIVNTRITTTPAPEDTVWDAIPPFRIDREDQVVAGRDAWSGPDDCSAVVEAAQLIRTLFVRVRVRDDHPSVVSASETGAADEVLVSFDTARTGALLARRRVEGTDAARVVSLSAVPSEAPREVPPFRRAWQRCVATEDGYTVLLCIPWESVSGLVLKPGEIYAFDVIVVDADPEGVSRHRLFGLSPDPEDLFLGGVLSVPVDRGDPNY